MKMGSSRSLRRPRCYALLRYALNCMALLVASFVFLTPQASAGIISVSGKAKFISSPPHSIRNNAWQSNRRIRVFQEQVNCTLDEQVRVDISTSGVFTANAHRTVAMLPTDAMIDSYLVHQDSYGRKRVKLRGKITFDSDILGIVTRRGDLNHDDGVFGLTDIIYPRPTTFRRGIELRPGRDRIRISEDMRTIIFRLVTSNSIDQLRILTLSSTPVPGPGALALLGLAGLIAPRRARR